MDNNILEVFVEWCEDQEKIKHYHDPNVLEEIYNRFERSIPVFSNEDQNRIFELETRFYDVYNKFFEY